MLHSLQSCIVTTRYVSTKNTYKLKDLTTTPDQKSFVTEKHYKGHVESSQQYSTFNVFHILLTRTCGTQLSSHIPKLAMKGSDLWQHGPSNREVDSVNNLRLCLLNSTRHMYHFSPSCNSQHKHAYTTTANLNNTYKFSI